MKFRVSIVMLWIMAALCAQGAAIKMEFLQVRSTVYSNVTVLGYNASDLYFTSDHGIRNVKLRWLSPELQQKFHYDPAEAQKAEEQQEEDEKRYRENLAAQITAEYNAAQEAKAAVAQAPYAEAGLAEAVPGVNSPIGKPAPELDMEHWVGNKPNMDKKIVLISVWSPKSASCRKWIPALNDLYKSMADQMQIVGVTTASVADVNQSDPRPDFPCAIDSDARFISAANITVFPCVILLDTNHVVRYQGHPSALSATVLQGIFKRLDTGSAENQ